MRRHLPDVALATAIVAVVAMMIVPLPAWALDVLLAANLSLSILLLLTAVLARSGMRFTALPTILLVTTLFRLALNVSSTRLILLTANPGSVIRAFGDFVVGGSYVVGAVIFLILTLIQFVVIARGSERVAEVGARFTLDAMPGKQMAIDADLRSGALSAAAAQAQRRDLSRESQFYGAMDGAMKFVKGDAIASIAISVVNLVGGLVVGVVLGDLSFEEGLTTYGLLTVGDGLVSQIPALVISTAAGLVVTRVASHDERAGLGRDFVAQVFGDARGLAVAAGMSLLLGIVPGLPLLPFWILALVLGAIALLRRRAEPANTETSTHTPTIVIESASEFARSLNPIEDSLPELARFEARFGVELPTEVRPNASMSDEAFTFTLGFAGQGQGHGLEELRRALTESVLARLHSLWTLDGAQRLLDQLSEKNPVLVRAVVPERITLARLSQLVRDLLSERVPIGDLSAVLEALSHDPLPKDPDGLREVVRQRIGTRLTAAARADADVLPMLAVDPLVEETLRDSRGTDGVAELEPELLRELVESLAALKESNSPRAIVTQPDVRAALARLLAPHEPQLPVLSYRELDPLVKIRRVGVLGP